MPDMGSIVLENEDYDFQVGQKVKVKVPLEVLRTIQEGHGGFTPKMCESMTSQGEIMEVTEKGDLRVRYPNNVAWTLNPEAVRRVTQEDETNTEQHNAEPVGYTSNFVCIRCWENLPSNGTRGECYVCSESGDMCLLEPCGHKIACIDCTALLKKCCTCHELITRRVSPDGNVIEYISKEQRPSLERMRGLELMVKNFEDSTTCNICLENKRDRVFRCGHSCCTNCSRNVRTCHICRNPVNETIHLY